MMNDRNPEGQVRGPDPGLCGSCEHVQRVTSARGSTFYLCRLSFVDARFARYPPLPVLACSGFTISEGTEGAGTEKREATDLKNGATEPTE
jgi:hypothetical protein